jgi:Uma2 family endonuclease
MIDLNTYDNYIDQGYGTLRASAFIDPGKSEHGAVVVSFFNASQNNVGTVWDSGWQYSPGTHWLEVANEIPIPATARSAKIAIFVTRSSGSYTDVNVDDVTVRVRFIYPDITVICEAPNLTFSNPPNLLNPSVIFEILSPSTEADDRFLKLPRLMQMATLNEIVFISSERMAIEHYVRRGTEWVVTPIGPGPDSTLTLSSLSISIPIADIYEEVDFTPAAAPKQG